MDLGLKGKVAIITGGSYGIGKGVAMRLAEEGARVVICARREDILKETAAEIEKAGGEVLPVVADVMKKDDCERLVRSAVERFGRVDILFNNAGAGNANSFMDTTPELWQEDHDLKVIAAVRLSQLCVPEMRKQGGGRIINLTIIRGKQPAANSVPTAVSRAAGIAMTKALSKDLAPDNILVNTICVGVIRSGQHERRYQQVKEQYGSLEEYYRAMSKDIPLKRFGEPEEVGDLVAFLASERARYITGDAINIDGGTSGAV
jgi:3-oxoacyl-[acyl-carrier protein] reductase